MSPRSPAEGVVCLDCAQRYGFVPMPNAVWADGVCTRCQERTEVALNACFTHARLDLVDHDDEGVQS